MTDADDNVTASLADAEAQLDAYWNDPSLPVSFDVDPHEMGRGNVTYTLRDGWKLVVFIGCGEWDYIDHIEAPDGTVFDPENIKPPEDCMWHPIFYWSPKVDDARWGRFWSAEKNPRTEE